MMPKPETIDELALLDETIGRIRSRLGTGDDSELPALGALLLKYLERRASVTSRDIPDANPGSIASVTRKLQAVSRGPRGG